MLLAEIRAHSLEFFKSDAIKDTIMEANGNIIKRATINLVAFSLVLSIAVVAQESSSVKKQRPAERVVAG